jgi:SAM-dependent methyltransferase
LPGRHGTLYADFMSNFDDDYRATPAMFGEAPEALLVRHLGRLPRDGLVLDVGAGQGRHSLWLGRRGLRVLALDPSRVGLAEIARQAAAEGLAIETRCGLVKDVQPPAERFGAILLLGLIPLLPQDAVERLGRQLPGWLAPGGVLLATAFTTADPGAGRKGFTYLEPGRLAELFGGLEVIELREHLGPPHRHGDGPLERHAMAEVAARRSG